MKKQIFSFLIFILFFASCSHHIRKPSSLLKSWQLHGFSRPLDLQISKDRAELKENLSTMLKIIKNDVRPKSGNWPEYFLKNSKISNKKLKKSFQFMLQSLEDFDHSDQAEHISWITEVHRSLELNLRNPVGNLSIPKIIKMGVRDLVYTPALHGNKASYLGSNLWQDPGDIAAKDLHFGFERTHLPITSYESCVYEEAKSGYGIQPGYVVDCAGRKVKIKFKEVHSEAFATRIFWALGYNVEPVDAVEALTIKYERRILTEYNSRKKINFNLTVFGKVIVKKSRSKYRDPLEGIDKLILKDGKVVAKKDVANFLFKNPQLEKPELNEENFNLENEANIASIVTEAVQVQISNEKLVKIGPWDFNDFEHENYREMRGLVLLGAWLNWYDARYDNNRLVLKDKEGKLESKFYLNDVGSTLGKINRMVHFRKNTHEDAQNFGERFTEKKLGKFRFKMYRIFDENRAFNQSTMQDVVWMAKLMLQLQPEQIKAALIGSNMPAAEVDVFHKKLVKRLEHLREDIGDFLDK